MEIARELARRGARVSLVARSAEPLEKLAADLDGAAFPVDLTDGDELDDLVERVEAEGGPLDVVVNNAAVAPVGRLVDQAAGIALQTYALNVVAPIELSRQVLPGMLARGRGRVLNISSLAGITAFPTIATYGSSKSALAQFTASMQRELRRTPVRFTIAQLGEVAGTDMMENARTSPTIAAVSARLARTRALPDVTTADVARHLADAVERGCRHVVVPRRVTPFQLLRELPSRLNDGILLGIE